MDIMQKCIVHRQNGINNGENCKQETYTNVVPMSKEAFIRFMITQSNVIAQVEENGQSLEKAIKWFEESLEPVFHGTIQNLVFDQSETVRKNLINYIMILFIFRTLCYNTKKHTISGFSSGTIPHLLF